MRDAIMKTRVSRKSSYNQETLLLLSLYQFSLYIQLCVYMSMAHLYWLTFILDETTVFMCTFLMINYQNRYAIAQSFSQISGQQMVNIIVLVQIFLKNNFIVSYVSTSISVFHLCAWYLLLPEEGADSLWNRSCGQL